MISVHSHHCASSWGEINMQNDSFMQVNKLLQEAWQLPICFHQPATIEPAKNLPHKKVGNPFKLLLNLEKVVPHPEAA